ncbi:unnamed protein product [Orchesella dallaii]|uniref:Odorant receptor n=1 Tax=Orchesella dallaii TaxID=48710 RepID=A0ABP1S223_9HEXA
MILTQYYIIFKGDNKSQLSATHRKFDGSKFAQSAWNVVIFKMSILAMITTFRIKFLATHWRQNLESLGVLVAALCLYLLAISAYTTLNRYKTEICYSMNQRFKLIKMNGRILNRDSFSNKHSISSGELIIYTGAMSFIGFLIFGASFPFIIREDPIQHYLTQWTMSLLPALLVKCVESLIYDIMTVYGSVIMITILLWFITIEEAILKLSAELLHIPKLADVAVRMRGSHLITLKLEKRLILYRILQILVNIVNSITNDFAAVLVGIGIVATSSMGAIVVLFYDIFPLYLSSSYCLMIIKGKDDVKILSPVLIFYWNDKESETTNFTVYSRHDCKFDRNADFDDLKRRQMNF